MTEPENATADCGVADPDVVTEILDAMPIHFGARQRRIELDEREHGGD